MKWLRLSTVAVSVLALALIIGMVAVFSIDVKASVQNQVEAIAAPAPAFDDAPVARPQPPSPSNEIKDFQQLD